MAKLFVRVDDRLIHGQIVTAWAGTLGIKEIIAIDDTLAPNPMLKSIMLMGVPAVYHPKIVTSEEAKALLQKDSNVNRLEITRFCRNRAGIRQELQSAEHVNLGNCSKQPDTVRNYPSSAGRYLCLNQADIDTLDALESDGLNIICQLLPTEKKRTWQELKKNV